ncbi:hypothetical protein FNH05_36185 [Amycolatopsis rhizosphaerae]|uniref:Uncharacterized protein n=2 Tax=Amycolatopsis rhizosphaerae TaxID=2053003 RepID=A0A557ZYZ3_9PSEU|nr:hypothetical protein FNH05_36185 [Amycolatopsis rhizosphaerae]
MDASNTQQIPRDVVNRIDRGEDPDTTAVVPASVIDSVQGSLPEKPGTRVDLSPVTQPLRHPRAQAGQAQPPARSQAQAQEREVEGLIPTTTQSTGRSDLSRRLEGL